MTHSATDRNAPRLARTLSEMPSVVAFSDRTDGGLSLSAPGRAMLTQPLRTPEAAARYALAPR